MIKRYLACLTLFLALIPAHGQSGSYELVDIVTDDFPFVEARFKVPVFKFNPRDFILQDVSIIENDQALKPLFSQAPVIKEKELPVSVVLALDISSSMNKERMGALKASTKRMIKQLPLEISEVAIATFNTHVALNCDFTHNEQTLLDCIDSLDVYGGTDFDEAFLARASGLIDIARQGQHRKLIIFISDGLCDVDVRQVAGFAMRHSIMVNCLTVGVPISNQLIEIATKTGGVYSSNLSGSKDIQLVLKDIYIKTQTDCYGRVKWRSNYSCNPQKKTQITLGNQTISLQYQVPDSMLGFVEASHAEVYFKNNANGDLVYKPIFLKGKNVDLNISAIESSNAQFFGTKQDVLTIEADANQLQKLELSFNPQDSVLASAEYTIKSKGCPDVSVKAYAGGKRKLVITNPLADETYVAGSTVPIKWTGMLNSDVIDLFYQKEGDSQWHDIGKGKAGTKSWKAPAINGKVRIKGSRTGDITFSNLMTAPVALMDGSIFKSAFYNRNGSEIISQSINGKLKNWDAKTGQLKHEFEEAIKGEALTFPVSNRIIDLSPNGMNVFTNRNGLLIKDLSTGEGKNLTSLAHKNEQEYYITLKDFTLLLQNTKYLDYTSAPKTGFGVGRSNSKLHVLKLADQKTVFDIKLTSEFEKSVLHARLPILAVANKNNTHLYHLKTKKKLFTIEGRRFHQFTKEDRYLMTRDSLNYYFHDMKEGRQLISIDKQHQFAISSDGTFVADISKDQVRIVNMVTQQVVWNKSHKGISHARFFPSSNRFLYLHKESLEVIDVEKGKLLHHIYCQSALINMLDISPDETSLLMTCDNVIAILNCEKLFHIGDLGLEEELDMDVTPYFNIVCPKPTICDQLTFPEQFINEPVEKVFPGVIKNTNEHTVFIDSIYIKGEGATFSLVSHNGPMAIQAKESKAVELRFAPQNTGKNTGELVVVSGGSNHVCQLGGLGIKKGFELLTPELLFSAISVGHLSDTIIPIVKNTGSKPLSMDGIKLYPANGSAFSISRVDQRKMLAPNDTLWAKVSFQPKRRGRQTAMIHLKMDNGEWMVASRIFGEGVAKRKVVIQGSTIHAITKKALKSVVRVSALNTETIVNQMPTDNRGAFTLTLNTDINYGIDAHLKGYFSSSENINLTDVQLNDTISVQLELLPLDQNSTIRLNNIFFESAKADLLDISQTEILRIVAFMKENKHLKIEIHGHTDAVGSVESNKQLSRQRALAVKHFMVNHKIESQRISIQYFGEEQAISNNETEEGRQRNRRVEVRFID